MNWERKAVKCYLSVLVLGLTFAPSFWNTGFVSISCIREGTEDECS